MSADFQILEYARAGSSIEDIPGAKRIQLARPSAWPKIVVYSITLPILVLAALILVVFGVSVFVASRVVVEAVNGIVILLIAVLPAAVGYQLILELLSVQRGGNRPITLVLGDRAMLIDDAAQRTTIAIEVRQEQVISLDLTPLPTAVTRQKVWTLRITGFETELEIQFLEKDNARALAVLTEIKSCLKAPLPLREGGA